MSSIGAIGDEVEVVIEVPRGSFTKRRPDGRVHFVSPFPSPFNYGSVPDTRSPDGDPLDAIVLGPRRSRGERLRGRVRGVVRFIDHGVADPKLVVSASPLRRRDRIVIELFFRVYAPAKTFLDPGRGRTRYEGFRVP